MAEKRIAVVTAGNKGIGFETCRKLACNGVSVILTARNEKNGIEAVEKLKASGLEDVIFHPLDIKDSASITSLAKFVETHYKKLDILVNNAGQMGDVVDFEKFRSIMGGDAELGLLVNDDNVHLLDGIVLQPHDKAKECLDTNYYGTKNVTEALLPLLQLSKSPRIVCVSSMLGLLIFIHSEGIKAELSNVETLTEGKIDAILQGFLKDLKDNNLKSNGWPLTAAAYKISKAAVNAYTRMMAKKYPNILINCVHPGLVNTDMTFGTGPMTPEEGARGPAFVALLPDDAPSGRYFDMTKLADY